MPEILNRFKFEPDSNARQNWLGTRKKPKPYGNQMLPGFYDTVAYEKDSSWVLLAVCIESVAIGLTLYGGFSKGGYFLFGAIIAVILFVIFDIVGANFFHRPKADRCKLNNLIFCTTDAGVRDGYRGELKRGLGFQIMGACFIVLSSALKIVAILLLGRFNLIFYVIMSIFYILVVYIHIEHTGYYLAERSTSRKFRKQHEIWANKTMKRNGGNGEELRYSARLLESRFPSEIMLTLVNNEVAVGGHKITYIEVENIGNKQIYNYKITTNGILIDSDINLFLNNQNPTQAGIIALACLKHQVERIH